MTSKSKSKGNAWELEIAKFLTDTYKSTFLRVPSSGAFVGGKNNFRKAALDQGQLQGKKGDVQPPSDWNYFNLEAKSYADFPFYQLWTSDLKMLDSWIQQQHDVEDEGDLNLILIKISHKGKWVVYQENLGFESSRALFYKGWFFTSWDDFWTKPVNVSLVKQYSTGSVTPNP